ncbi:beta-lactamase/transpeptidase-like protein, partial [Basidiobolus meristosporus CBS 931.73]
MLLPPILISLCGIAALHATKVAPLREITTEEIKSFSDDYFHKVILDGKIPGAVLSVVKGDEVIYSAGYGFSDLSSGIQADPEKTLLQAGLVSELFTTTAVLQLLEAGIIENLNDTANNYLREPTDRKGFRIADMDFFTNVTIEHLLTHTSGLDEKFSGTFGRAEEIDVDVRSRFAKFPERVRDVDVLSSYSYYNMAALGYMVSRLTGTPFPEYMKDNVLSPLAMKSSTFTGYNRTDELVERLISSGSHFATGYEQNAEGGVSFSPSEELYMALLPTGGLFTTAADMGRFMVSQLNGGVSKEGKRALQEQNVEKMLSQQRTSHALLDGVCYGYFETKYENGVRMISHVGDMFGQTSQIALFPEENLGIFLWHNSNSLAIRRGYIERLLAHFYGIGELSSLDDYDAEFFINSEPWKSRSEDYEGAYRPVRVPKGNYEKVISVFLEATIKAGHEHDLTLSLSKDLSIYFGTSTIQLREIGRNMFKIINPSPELKSKRYVYFEETLNGYLMHTGVFDVP